MSYPDVFVDWYTNHRSTSKKSDLVIPVNKGNKYVAFRSDLLSGKGY